MASRERISANKVDIVLSFLTQPQKLYNTVSSTEFCQDSRGGHRPYSWQVESKSHCRPSGGMGDIALATFEQTACPIL